MSKLWIRNNAKENKPDCSSSCACGSTCSVKKNLMHSLKDQVFILDFISHIKLKRKQCFKQISPFIHKWEVSELIQGTNKFQIPKE